MKKLLWLDDVRDPNETIWNNWIAKNAGNPSDYKIFWVKDYVQFVSRVLENGLPHTVCFDHDLAYEHYEYTPEKEFQNLTWAETGYDCAKWMTEYCKKHNLPFPNYAVQSANPVGKQRIINLIEDFKKHRPEYDTEGNSQRQ